jgi:dolichol-phosphate mannosyltransferase
MSAVNGQAQNLQIELSLVVPIHNEEGNVSALLDEVDEVLVPIGGFEALLVDDGSLDNSLEAMVQWKAQHKAEWLRIVHLESRSGQSGALMAGIEQARGSLVCTMDGDLQNDPRDLLRMLELLEDDALAGVTGVRAQRRDGLVRRISSKIGNRVRNAITGDRVTDSACGIKMFRRRYWLTAPRFNGMHRFMPTLVRYAGGEVHETPVNHRPRRACEPKYGIGNRALRGLRDCMAVRWYRSRILRFRVSEES